MRISDHPARRRALQPEHAVDEDRAVHVLGVETVERRIELRMRRLRRDLQGIEIGFEMADHAVGANKLDGANGFLRCEPEILLAGNRLARGPVARQRADQFAILELRLGIAAPFGAAADLGGLQRGLSQPAK